MRVSLFMLLAVMFLTIPHIAGAQSAQERREARLEQQEAQRQAQQERREAQRQAQQERREAQRQAQQERREAQRQAQQERREAQRQAQQERRQAQQNRRPTPNNPVNVPEIDAMSGSAALAALGGALLLMRERRRL
jgi:flagellar biosynthesis GTPase FlhF